MTLEETTLEQARGAFHANIHALVTHPTLERKPETLRALVERAEKHLGKTEVASIIKTLPEALRAEVLAARGN